MATIDDLASVIETVVDDKISKTQKKTGSVIATVNSKDLDGTIWVTLDGGVEKTPITTVLADVQPGDVVAVRIENGRSYIDGNATSPAASGRSVEGVRETAEKAQETGDAALESAAIAKNAADSAIADAAIAREAAEDAAEDAASASSSASAAASAASTASAEAAAATTAAAAATTAAGNAQIAANAANFALSDVEKVVGTLEWIAEHGEYEPTEDTAVVAGKVYYTRSGTSPNYTYTVVAEPKTADIATYYELHMDESVQNYLATHLWMDMYGLNLSVDSANGYRIHQGTVDGTKAIGMYVLDATGAIVASFGANGFQVGTTGESHLVGDYHSLQLIDKADTAYLHVSDLRDTTGYALISERFYGDGSTLSFRAQYEIHDVVSVYIPTGSIGYTVSNNWAFVFESAPPDGSIISVRYHTASTMTKAFTFGSRKPNTTVGGMSYAEGHNVTANGSCTHAEGYATVASGGYSHAEGYESEADGMYSHAEGYRTTASGVDAHSEGRNTVASGSHSHAGGYDSIASGLYSFVHGLGLKAVKPFQAVFGQYNEEDPSTSGTPRYLLIIGNGTSDSARSNALTVGWDGHVETGGLVDIQANQPEIDFTTPNTNYMSYIRSYDTNSAGTGHNMVIQSGGNMFLGGGESPAGLYNLAVNGATDIPGLTSESPVIGADSWMYFFSNCNTIANRQRMAFGGADGVLEIPGNLRLVNKTELGTYYPNARANTDLGYVYGQHIRLRSREPDLDNNATSRTAQVTNVPLDVTDQDNNPFMRLTARQLTDGTVRGMLEVAGAHTGSTVWNAIYADVRKDGSQHYGVNNTANFRSDLGINNATNLTIGTLPSDRLPTVPIAKGGTGATTAAAARTNLGFTRANLAEKMHAVTIFSGLSVAKGGTLGTNTAVFDYQFFMVTSASTGQMLGYRTGSPSSAGSIRAIGGFDDGSTSYAYVCQLDVSTAGKVTNRCCSRHNLATQSGEALNITGLYGLR